MINVINNFIETLQHKHGIKLSHSQIVQTIRDYLKADFNTFVPFVSNIFNRSVSICYLPCTENLTSSNNISTFLLSIDKYETNNIKYIIIPDEKYSYDIMLTFHEKSEEILSNIYDYKSLENLKSFW